MYKVGFISLGCAKNLVDTEVMLGILTQHNLFITDDPHDADILIINTCTFIDAAKEESISTILQMAEYKKNGLCRSLIVAGCLGQRYQQELLDELPEVDAIVGTGAWHRIMEAVDATIQGHRLLLVGKAETIYDDSTPRITTTPEYSAYIKIAEGCDNCCSYCVIPSVRGSFRSRTIPSVFREASALAARGVQEINLIAQDTTSYGRDLYGKPRLTELLQELVKVDGIRWLRLLYCYPKYFSDELIHLIAEEAKICKYIDLPLQHADNEILKAMNRQDTREEIEILLAKLRKQIPGVVIRTSMIVGFPGETEEQFNNLYQFVEKQRFERMGVFIYSQEEDTPAAALSEQIPEEIKQERYHALMSLQCKISEELNLNLEGHLTDVLIEGFTSENPDIAYGRSCREAPDVDGRIYIENAGGLQRGQIVHAKIVQGFTYDLLAETLPQQ
ncbi:MAG: 30S ribosomal protein S12 methylthiotransferase RimO [Negativicutes bacterium]